MSDTTYPDDAWVRLGRAVKRRRIELGMSQTEVDAAGGPSAGVVSKIENAKQSYYEDRVFADLERALQWRAGSAESVLSGNAPTPLALTGSLPSLTAEAHGTVSEPEEEPDSPITADLVKLLQAANDRLAELANKVDEQNRKLDEQGRRIEEMHRDQQENGRRRKGA